MDLALDKHIASGYQSRSQIGRIISENWIERQMYCPFCESNHLQHYENNRPVADFWCPVCHEEFELKSKVGSFSHLVADGAYSSMVRRIASDTNPNFLFMSYDGFELNVNQLFMVPKYYMTMDIVRERKPLPSTARRAGWIGCNLDLAPSPREGIVSIIHDGVVSEMESVRVKVRRTRFIADVSPVQRGWLLETLLCVESIPQVVFRLNDLYSFEDQLNSKYPLNNNVRAKLRQQLQKLRDQGYIEFLGKGQYRKK